MQADRPVFSGCQILVVGFLGFGADAQTEGVEGDEARGVRLVVDVVLFECDDFRIIERVRGAAAADEAVAFVELQIGRAHV